MRIDGANDEALEATYAGYVLADASDDSGDGVTVVQQESLPEQFPQNFQDPIAVPAAVQTPPIQPAPVRSDPVEPMKACCICGLDLAQKPRSRDSAGRHWCDHCIKFSAAPSKTAGLVPCLDCGRETRPMLMVDRAGERICKPCGEICADEKKQREVYKTAVTTNLESELRRSIREMIRALGGAVAAAALVTLYHFHLLYFAPKPWAPFLSALIFCGTMALGVVIAIAVQYARIGLRLRTRRADYDRMIQAATNHVLALDDDSNNMGISEPPEPQRRRIERAILRVQACGGLGMPDAGKILDSLSKNEDTMPLTQFLSNQRPNTPDTVARNREIAIISYLQVDLATAGTAVTAILLRTQYDQEAMTRLALIRFRKGELPKAKEIFKRVIHIAREKNNQLDLAAAFCNLGMLHMMLNEFDDAAVRYSQAMGFYKKLDREDGIADCLLNLGIIAFKQKKWAEVEDQLRQAMAINQRQNRREGLAICCSLLGVILVEKEVPELKEARKLLNRAVQLNLELGRAGGVAAAYGNLGLVCVKREDFDGATELFHKALNIYQRIRRPKMAVKIQGMLKTVSTLNAAKAVRDRRS